MSMPLSGCIALKYCITACDCSSVSCAVNGSAIGEISLTTLSEQVGWSLPHCMTEFYGYPSGGTVHVCMTMGFSCILVTTPNQRFTTSLSGAVGEDVCIENFHADGFDAGGGDVASATATGTNFIEYLASTAGSRYTKTNETCDAAWDNATQYAYLSPSFVANGTTISTPSPNAGSCITLSNGDIVEFCFHISCTPL